MANYTKLLLSAGGGIVSAAQQANQSRDTASVLIGLGGTGNDCLRAIKTQVYERLKPDHGDNGGYQHIQFLGIDTVAINANHSGSNGQAASKPNKILNLDTVEYLPIGDPSIKNTIQHLPTMESKTYASWLSYEKIAVPLLGTAGAGGVRQIGRFMMYEKSEEVFNRIQEAIDKARMGLIGSNRLNVHIFAGISGGTGSGTFLDICYIVRELTKDIPDTTIFGYFFLPDVNLARIPLQDKAHQFVPLNGYAAMQELDFCMNLGNNKAGFVQEYGNGKKVEWKEPPVDMAHLICATNASSAVIKDAYNYAMGVTAEYVMDFLTEPIRDDKVITLVEQHSNFVAKVNMANQQKKMGINLNYCVLGAASARIPLKEINTYLASHLFNKFSTINTRKPIEREVEKLAAKALGSMNGDRSGIYQSLQNEMEKDAGAGYRPYPDDWRSVKDFGNKALVEWYYDQNAEKIGHLESNGKGLQDKNNPLSLVNRIKSELKNICRDYNKGPIYAYGTLSAAAKLNIQNIVNGIREENKEKWDLERAQSTLRKDEYEKARKEFENNAHGGLFSNGTSLFRTYEFRLRALCEHQYYLSFYEKMDALLGELEEQLSSLSSTYFKKLSSIMESLIHVFNENAQDLNNYSISGDGFSMPMLQLSELKPSMDRKIEEINIPQMLDSFMDLMLKNDEIWLREDEAGICRLVNDFFTQTAFSDFSNQTINDFLIIKFGVDGPALVDKILEKYINPLTAMASPLFGYNTRIWTPAQQSQMAYISVPQISTSIKNAALQKQSNESLYNVKTSELTDRIYVMSASAAVPLAAYSKLDAYSNDYYSKSYMMGRHYYEGKKQGDMKFTSWDKLPPIIPASRAYLGSSSLNEKIKEYVLKSNALLEQAEQFHLIDKKSSQSQHDIFTVKPELKKELTAWMEEKKKYLDAKKSELDNMNPDEIETLSLDLSKYTEEITNIDTDSILEKSNLIIPKEGDAGFSDVILKDNFANSPYIQKIVEENVNIVNSVIEKKMDLLNTAKSMDQEIEKLKFKRQLSQQTFDLYCQALFSGIVEIKGPNISYTTEFGETVQLSKMGDSRGFPLNSIPPYQGFLKFQELEMETQLAIQEASELHYQHMGEEFIKYGKKLKDEVLTEVKFNSWKMQTGKIVHTNERREAVDFLSNMQREFKNFCSNFDI